LFIQNVTILPQDMLSCNSENKVNVVRSEDQFSVKQTIFEQKIFMENLYRASKYYSPPRKTSDENFRMCENFCILAQCTVHS